MKDAIRINKADNAAVALTALKKGEKVLGVTLREDIAAGHKFALAHLKKDENVLKYGSAIGRAVRDIEAGEHIHIHNVKTNLNKETAYAYNKVSLREQEAAIGDRISVYERKNGECGIRNELWIIPTVGCVNSVARAVAERFNSTPRSGIDGAHAFTHPYGCSQTGCDHERTRTILQKLVRHPNAGGVLVLGLGCENNNLEEFKKTLGEYDTHRVMFLSAQETGDEIAEGLKLLEELYERAKNDVRVWRGLSVLKVGLKCGGSDGLSGITANPLLGRFSDRLIASGGSSVLTEVPEMFGAEHVLTERARDKEVFDKIVRLVEGFKEYYRVHGEEIYENPSPGNKEGGITTLEDKSLGCVQKGGGGEIADVLFEKDFVKTKGLSLLDGPGNDLIAVTNLAAAGCQLILFTTGRGTPLGSVVPVVKVSTNDALSRRKSNWIDFNAGRMIAEDAEAVLEDFTAFIVDVVNGKPTKNEITGSREISIFKSGIIL